MNNFPSIRRWKERMEEEKKSCSLIISKLLEFLILPVIKFCRCIVSSPLFKSLQETL